MLYSRRHLLTLLISNIGFMIELWSYYLHSLPRNYMAWIFYILWQHHPSMPLFYIIIWSRDTRLTILITFFCGWISQDNLSVSRDRNNLLVLILNLLRIRDDVMIYNLMTLHSYHNTCGNLWKIAGQFTQVKCSASKLCQWIFSNPFTNRLKTCLHNWPNIL